MSCFVILVAFLIILSKVECIDIFCPRTDTFGPSKNVTCVLPFRFQGNVYSQCTNTTFKDVGKFWCPTKVGRDGSHMVDKNDWGYCHKNCSEVQEPQQKQRGNISATNLTSSSNQTMEQRNEIKLTMISLNITQNLQPVKDKPGFNVAAKFKEEKPPKTFLPNSMLQECGQQLGKSSVTTTHPFVAALGYEDRFGNVTFECEGVLISPWYILAPAHCHTVEHHIDLAILGSLNKEDLMCESCSHLQKFDVDSEDITIHEGYIPRDEDINENDLALIRLRNIATISSKFYVSPVCLPDSNAQEESSTSIAIVPWLSTFSSNKSDSHSIVSAQVVHDEICKVQFFKNMASKKQLCAGPIGKGSPSCNNYSGSHLIATSTVDKLFVLQGLTSSENRICDPQSPEVFTNINYYIDWIVENMRP